ncbi:hypothetical protein [Streptomyces wuyuanensis]|uniref:Uncharacterized protein n=1 Tax=Streptomyces wuyuanensis TaxID=1196353 RepID=A0A1G9MYY3_9ACTN|nr:hypothetical protein [Streptomyces wuyuanensis]SDL79500.1 hypothetical protein SAMN05444921_101380 [Streptomyces wuyuanensis]
MRAESSPAARTGAFVSVAVARFRVRPGFSAPNAAAAVPAASVAVIAVHHRPGAPGTVPPPASGAKRGGGTP